MLREHPDVTAVVVMNDEAAPGLLRAVRATGRSVPGDVSVLGLSMAFRMAAVCEPPLVHLAPSGFELGHAAALSLIDHLEDPSTPPIRTLLPCVLGEGLSLAPPPPF
jgi:DNA-binding LacI/PurR family transcriptional regulator